jgi:23S rRNA pseudouridine1911/1915/1917 synthase
MTASRLVTTDRGDVGRRLDLVLQRHLKDVASASRTQIQSWIESGHVAVNGVVVRRVSARAQQGDLLSILLPEPPTRAAMAPENLILDVLYEDDYLLAVNKPAGIVVHPTYRHATGTLMNALLWHARGWEPDHRPSLVGRLDKLTSGIVIVAKTRAIHAALQRAIASAACEKDYLAIVHGHVNVRRGAIDLRLARDPDDRRRVVASTTIGVPSVTTFERLAHRWFEADGLKTVPHRSASFTGDSPQTVPHRICLSLLRCRLHTGRMHQIRVHLAARGWPLVGDPKYGGMSRPHIADPILKTALASFPRQALHASHLRLPHPFTRRTLSLEAQLPSDLQILLSLLRLDTKFNEAPI